MAEEMDEADCMPLLLDGRNISMLPEEGCAQPEEDTQMHQPDEMHFHIDTAKRKLSSFMAEPRILDKLADPAE